MTIKVMSAEVLYDSLVQALGSEPSFGGGGGGRGPALTGRQAFVRFFDTKDDGDDATDSGHGIPQFLRLMNSPQFNRGGAITQKLAKENVSQAHALESLYLATLARRPNTVEMEKLTAYLAKQADAKKGYDNVLWVLLNSAEFICIR
jgi:hypothetical protein